MTSSKILEQYFEAWSAHDANALDDIFHPNAIYEIQNKRSHSGLKEIKLYWQRNKSRQRNLKTFPTVLLHDDVSSASCVFCAKFVDTEEAEVQTVYGHLRIECTEGKISRLTEIYHVLRSAHAPSANLKEEARERFRVWYWTCKGWLAQANEFMLTRGGTIATLLMATLLGFSAWKIDELPDWLLCGLDFNLSQCGSLKAEQRASLSKNAFKTLSSVTSVFLCAVVFLGWLRYHLRHPITQIPLQAKDHDLQVMRDKFNDADHVTIFSGDFDFVGRDAKMQSILKKLQSRGGLKLVSSVSRDKVKAGFGSSPTAIKLFEDLDSTGNLKTDTELPIHCSLVKLWNRSEILYRYKGGGLDQLNDLHICVLKGRKEAEPIIELIKRLQEKLAT